ncbi:MAG: ATP-binding protein [Bacteroidales bacterium]|nr:ATP-binding protein [Bacteroidales bacterium]
MLAIQTQTTTPTSDVRELSMSEQRILAALIEKGFDADLTQEEQEQFDALNSRHEAAMRAAEERKRQQQEEGRRAEAEYRRQLQQMEELRNAQKDSMQYFVSQLQARYNQRAEQFQLGGTAEQVAAYLAAAYKHEVERMGRTYVADDNTQRILADAARWLLQHSKPGLMLRGNVGVGKTTLLYAMRSTIGIRSGGKQNLIIWDARRIAPLAKGAEGQAKLDELCRLPLLGIDDLGTEALSVKDYGNDTMPLIELLTERYAQRRPTIITTNLTILLNDGARVDEIAERYGERIADRLRELCNTLSYSGSQKSYRQ